MDRNLKIFTLAAAALVLLGIVMIALLYFWNIHAGISASGGGGSLLFSYSTGNNTWLNQTQYTKNGSFAGPLYVEGTSDTMLIALLDYNVTAFYFNGSTNKTHMIAKNAYVNETHFVTPYDVNRPHNAFTVTGIPDGFHDIEFIGFVDPYNFSAVPWQSDGPLAAAGVRFNVIANNSTKIMPSFTDSPSSGGTIYSKAYEFPMGGPSLAKEPFSNRTLWSETAKGGSVIDYYVSQGHPRLNGNSTNHSFAIVQLLDYQQIPIRVGSPDTIYYGHMDKDTCAAVHLSLEAPRTPGNHKLIVMVLTDPYENLEVAPYVIDNQTWTNNRDILAGTYIEHVDIVVA